MKQQEFSDDAIALYRDAALGTYDFKRSRRFCTSSYYITLAGERVKVCCANGLCVTKYGVFYED